MCCISPVIAARVFGTKNGGPGSHLTLGCNSNEADWPHQGAVEVAKSLGNEVDLKDID